MIADAFGIASSPAYNLRFPGFVGCVTVVLSTTEVALVGTPHAPATRKVRWSPAESAGPPYGPGALRVSATRHGVTV